MQLEPRLIGQPIRCCLIGARLAILILTSRFFWIRDIAGIQYLLSLHAGRELAEF